MKLKYEAMVPLGRLELPHLAPEASALSSELQGPEISTITRRFCLSTPEVLDKFYAYY
jgi:hypothetical protein